MIDDLMDIAMVVIMWCFAVFLVGGVLILGIAAYQAVLPSHGYQIERVR